MEEQQSVHKYGRMNNQNSQANFIDLRLNTKQLMKDVEQFLTAKRTYYEQDPEGNVYPVTASFGDAMANDRGVTGILNMILLRAHHHCIQGNFDIDHYWENIANTREEITFHIIENKNDWGIEDSKLNYIIDNLMDFFEKVMSRLIDNEERMSYMQQFQTREVISNNEKRSNPVASLFSSQ